MGFLNYCEKDLKNNKNITGNILIQFFKYPKNCSMNISIYATDCENKYLG